MDFLSKLENIINLLLIKLGEKCVALIPLSLRKGVSHFRQMLRNVILHGKKSVIEFVKSVPSLLLSPLKWNYKEILKKQHELQKEKTGKFKSLILAPFLILKEWLESLSAPQAFLLMFFSGASVLSVFSIIGTGAKLIDASNPATRTPASSEEVQYERPEYYKKDKRQFTLTNFRVPVYFPEVNELRSLDIDFTATVSNRNARLFLEKREFQFRDYIIHEFEPFMANFPLTEEGKEILRAKLTAEINLFLKNNNIQGAVVEIKITYMLAN